MFLQFREWGFGLELYIGHLDCLSLYISCFHVSVSLSCTYSVLLEKFMLISADEDYLCYYANVASLFVLFILFEKHRRLLNHAFFKLEKSRLRSNIAYACYN